VANTASITLAQNLLPPEAWVPFFNLVTFALGVSFYFLFSNLMRALMVDMVIRRTLTHR
jgi:hypothetical protein